MDARLAGRAALVTGSTSGIGRAIAEAFADAGATVLVSGRRHELGEEVVAGIAGRGGRAVYVSSDLSGDVAAFAARAVEAGGGAIDVLVNNAAMITSPSPTADVSASTLDDAFAVNVRAPFLLTGLLAPLMAARGSGVVINIGSVNAGTGLAGSALYSMTKAANHSLTLSWAAEYGRFGVRVNTIAPGPTETESNLANLQHFGPIVAKTASGRLSRLAEIAAAAVFLAGDDAANIHGVTLPVDGGYSAVSRVTERPVGS
jgi:NAD(P)-dependent dehydrogenase (short-subunit alcohol dehydrogenase family)